MPSVISKKQAAKEQPITKISLALMSAGLSLFWYLTPDNVLCTSA